MHQAIEKTIYELCINKVFSFSHKITIWYKASDVKRMPPDPDKCHHLKGDGLHSYYSCCLSCNNPFAFSNGETNPQYSFTKNSSLSSDRSSCAKESFILGRTIVLHEAWAYILSFESWYTFLLLSLFLLWNFDHFWITILISLTKYYLLLILIWRYCEKIKKRVMWKWEKEIGSFFFLGVEKEIWSSKHIEW